MSKVINKKIELEILIATMNRTSLDFLSKMFLGLNFLDYNVLIINQTSNKNTLNSPYDNIRVINSFEKGLSKSRNIAINNAIKPICLLADDDIIFIKGFEEKIITAHKNNKAEIITFQTQTTTGNPYWKYPNTSTVHTNFISQKTLSIEITIKKNAIKPLTFNELFGLGATFEDAENYIFLSEAKKMNLNIWFQKETLSIHEPQSSSDDVKSDRLLYAKAAVLKYKYGKLAYLWVLKFVFFLFRKKHIPFNEIFPKIKLGFKAIKDYNLIQNESKN